jgi:predicted amidophosphoribosyltransferase
LQLRLVPLEGDAQPAGMANSLVRALTALVVPPLCVACREPELSGSPVCPGCEALLVALPAERCRRCGAPVGRECQRCGECRGRALAFEGAWAPFAYEGTTRDLVAALKSRGALSAAAFMGAAAAAGAPPSLLEGTLVPVPAHPLRRRRHGFNHAAELARAVGRRAGLPVLDALRREGPTRPQVGLERGARLANARRSVTVRTLPAGAIEGPMLLVDDVYTTGATLDACARALLAAGAARVAALTFARTVRA